MSKRLAYELPCDQRCLPAPRSIRLNAHVNVTFRARKPGLDAADLGTVFHSEIAHDAPGDSFKKSLLISRALLFDVIACGARLLRRATDSAHREISKELPGRPGGRSERARRAWIGRG